MNKPQVTIEQHGVSFAVVVNGKTICICPTREQAEKIARGGK
jgi:hypothetical protein